MSGGKNLAPVICDRCEKVFMGGPYTYLCPECRKQLLSENARKHQLSQKGIEARLKRNCGSCKYHDFFSGACFNGYSPRCADFTRDDEHCRQWSEKEEASDGLP